MKAIKRKILNALLFAFPLVLQAQAEQSKSPGNAGTDFSRDYKFTESESKVRDRLFYWSTLIEHNDQASQAISDNPKLAAILHESEEKFKDTAAKKYLTAAETAQLLSFSEAQFSAILPEIQALAGKSAFNQVTKEHILPCGAFNRFRSIADQGKLHREIVAEMLQGINNIISTYGAGVDPKYPKLDKISYDPSSPEYLAKVQELVKRISNHDYALFYGPQLDFALGLLELNRRDEAGRFMPLQGGENKKAYRYIQKVKWNRFPYSMIVVLGDSPNGPGDLPNISLGGMARVDHAVSLYREGLAPVIIMSGANVAPFQTVYFEAVEMKRYAMEKHGIPEEHIVIEPHSRHTTTNMRNVSRLWYRFGFPADKKGIISTAESQSSYVESDKFAARCPQEMGHQPIVLFKRLSVNDLEFLPRIDVLHLDSRDPLDP